jgi:hypothetical protein
MNQLIIESMAALISVWCGVDYPGYSRESKEVCIEYAVNACFDNYGRPSDDPAKRDECIERARSNLKRAKR